MFWGPLCKPNLTLLSRMNRRTKQNISKRRQDICTRENEAKHMTAEKQLPKYDRRQVETLKNKINDSVLFLQENGPGRIWRIRRKKQQLQKELTGLSPIILSFVSIHPPIHRTISRRSKRRTSTMCINFICSPHQLAACLRFRAGTH